MPDRAAIVTGASRGIGLALAKALGEEGFGLTLTARKPEPLQRTAEELQGNGFEVEPPAGQRLEDVALEGRALNYVLDRFGISLGSQPVGPLPSTERQRPVCGRRHDHAQGYVERSRA